MTMRMLLFPAVSSLVAFLALSPASAAPVKELSVTFTARTVTVTGVTHGADVVFFGIGLRALGVDSRPYRWSAVVQENGGTAVFTAAEDIPPNSVWAVVDVMNGHFSVVHVTGAMNEVKLAPAALRKGADGDVDVFVHPAIRMEGLYVHPGHGVLQWSAADGGSTDKDGRANGVIVLSLDAAKQLAGKAEQHNAFVPGGVLIAFDYEQLRAMAVRIDGSMLGGAK